MEHSYLKMEESFKLQANGFLWQAGQLGATGRGLSLDILIKDAP